MSTSGDVVSVGLTVCEVRTFSSGSNTASIEQFGLRSGEWDGLPAELITRPEYFIRDCHNKAV